MSNIIQKSTPLAVAEAITGSLKSILDGGVINIYAGTVPADANATKGSATLLRTISLTGTGAGLTFDTTAPNGVLAKPSAAVWQSEASGGTTANSGTATFWRFNADIADDNSAVASTTKKRLQGTCGTDASASMFLSTVALGAGVQTTLGAVQFVIPTA